MLKKLFLNKGFIFGNFIGIGLFLMHTLIIYEIITIFQSSIYPKEGWVVYERLESYLELSNFGINKAVNNTFSIYHNRNYKESNLIIINGFYLTVIIGITIISIISFLWDSIGAYEFLNLSLVSSNNSKIILILLTIKIFSDMVKGILCSYFFAQNKNL